jgi:hypothetical protein
MPAYIEIKKDRSIRETLGTRHIYDMSLPEVNSHPAHKLGLLLPLEIETDSAFNEKTHNLIHEYFVEEVRVVRKSKVEPKPVPETVTNSQARDALTLRGIFPHEVLAMINLIPDPVQKQLALNKWEYGNQLERAHPMLNALAPLLGLTQADIDAIFREASAL